MCWPASSPSAGRTSASALALGAQRYQVLAFVLCGGLKLVALGLALGLAAAAAATQLIQSFLYNVPALDPRQVYGAVAGLFTP